MVILDSFSLELAHLPCSKPHILEVNLCLNFKKKFSLLAILAAFLIGLAGCNTVKGVGKDVAALGNGVDHAATTVSNKM